MKNNNVFLKVFSLIAFIAFMLVSCWATVESLHMTLPWPKVAFWVVTIGIFVISSLGAKLIVDSFNMHKRLGGSRSWRLVGGIVIMLLFWVLFSVPTNTHTFFYNNKGNTEILKDIRRTKMYLQQLSNEQIEPAIIVAQNDCKKSIMEAFNNFTYECRNKNNPGYAGVAKQRLDELNIVLAKYGETPIVPLSNKTNKDDVEIIIKDYTKQVEDRADAACEAIKQKMLLENGIAMNNADEVLRRLNNDEKIIDIFRKRDTLLSPRDMKNLVISDLEQGYKILTNNNSRIQFENEYDKKLYSGQINEKGETVKNSEGGVESRECESARLFNVVSVWQDYFKGKYSGMGFFYWILVALLVDIAGFIFFTIFTKDM